MNGFAGIWNPSSGASGYEQEREREYLEYEEARKMIKRSEAVC